MNGVVVETVASSWMEALGGLSQMYIRSVPPCFWADTGPTASNSVAAKVARSRNRHDMISSLRRRGRGWAPTSQAALAEPAVRLLQGSMRVATVFWQEWHYGADRFLAPSFWPPLPLAYAK